MDSFELNKIIYERQQLVEDIDYIVKKLGITRDKWNEIMNLPLKKHTDYDTDYDVLWYKLYKKFTLFVKNYNK